MITLAAVINPLDKPMRKRQYWGLAEKTHSPFLRNGKAGFFGATWQHAVHVIVLP
jgi:hypothetical protein